jgi:hypothetical protein
MQNQFFRNILVLPFAAVLLYSCGFGVKEKVNSAGNAAGQVAGEFVEGAVQGASSAFDVKVDLAEKLEEKGIKLGKTTVSSDSTGTDNLLTVYVIFEKDFEGTVIAEVFDAKGMEMGRSVQNIRGKTKDAQFVDFRFDPRTNIDSNCKITIVE